MVVRVKVQFFDEPEARVSYTSMQGTIVPVSSLINPWPTAVREQTCPGRPSQSIVRFRRLLGVLSKDTGTCGSASSVCSYNRSPSSLSSQGDNFDCPFDGIPKPMMLVVPPIGSYLGGSVTTFGDWIRSGDSGFCICIPDTSICRCQRRAFLRSILQTGAFSPMGDTFSSCILAHSYSYGAEVKVLVYAYVSYGSARR